MRNSDMFTADVIIYILLLLGAVWSYTSKKLTLSGAITGAIIGLLIYKGSGYIGIIMLALFFIAGSWATGWQLNKKIVFGTTGQHKNKRTTGQVLANGGMAALLSAFAWHFPEARQTITVMVAGSFAAAIADTLSSELGTVYGRNFYNIITLKKDHRGLDGVVSLEGTLIGLAGATAIALIYILSFGWGLAFLWIVISGFAGNLADSVLGALFERKGWIGNNLVNFLNTAVGAGVCWLLLR